MEEYPHWRCRGWFSFGLRTMFVVLTAISLVSMWFGWQLQLVNDRREAMARLPVGGKRCGFAAICVDYHPGAANRVPSHFRRWATNPERLGLDMGSLTEFPKLPVWRRWMGDEPFSVIVAPATYSNADMQRLCRLFPETVFIARFREQPKRKVDMFRDLGSEPLDDAYYASVWSRFLFWPVVALIAIGAWFLARLLLKTDPTATAC